MTDPLPRSFYQRPTVDVARDLLGKLIVRVLPEGRRLSGIIVETEAYVTGDPASHAYRGLTPRNAVMFGPAGHVYMYISYGMHSMLNLVTEREGLAEAVLIRAIEPVDGIDAMRALRGGIDEFALTNGPGKLGQALGLTVKGDNGLDVTSPNSPLQVLAGSHMDAMEVGTSTRIGLSVGKEALWRFYVKGNRYVSKR
jgi:DNA-3-methyladenine glycosylase